MLKLGEAIIQLIPILVFLNISSGLLDQDTRKEFSKTSSDSKF